MTEPPTGLNEAVARVTGWDERDGTRAHAVQLAYPIIAAAVRADERAKVLAEVEQRISHHSEQLPLPSGERIQLDYDVDVERITDADRAKIRKIADQIEVERP